MPSDQPLLTIAVPTYNRSRYLARLLDSLKPQLANQQHVELLISDNASPDQTADLLDLYSRDGLVFRGIRNPLNLGADGNIAQCFAEAAGKYVWIIGDDDVLVPNGLRVILSLLDQDVYDIVHVGARGFVEGQPLALIPEPPKIQILSDASTFTRRTHVFLTFITGNIVNKERVDSLPHPQFTELIGTSLVQLGWTYTALAHLRKGAIVTDAVVATGSDDRGGYPLYTVFGTNLKRMTEDWFGQSDLARIVINGTLQTFFPGFVLRSRMKEGSFVEEDYEPLLHSLFAKNYRYYFFVYPVLKLPVQLARLWVLLCRIVNRLDRASGNLLLR